MSEKLVPKRQYTNEFKVEAIRLAETVGQHEAARRPGVPVAMLGNRSRRNRSCDDAGETSGREVIAAHTTRPVSELKTENSRLRKELVSAKLDTEILRSDGILLDAEVATIHRTHGGSYGRPHIVRQLRALGRAASEERVRRSLQRHGLRPAYMRPYRVTTDSTHSLPVAPNPRVGVSTRSQPNPVWVSDITFEACERHQPGRYRVEQRREHLMEEVSSPAKQQCIENGAPVNESGQ